MKSEIYKHDLLADKKLANHVHSRLEAGTIDNRTAYLAWFLIALCGKRYTSARDAMNRRLQPH